MYQSDDLNQLAQLESHFFVEWKERVTEDGMFEDEESETWKITKENGLEFIEALNIQEWVDEQLLNQIIDDLGEADKDGTQSIDFETAVMNLMKLVVVEKKVSIDELFNFDDCTLPIDRISKFLRMLKMDLEHKKNCLHGDGLTMIEERYLKEIEFTQHKINQRSIFNSSISTITKQQQSLKLKKEHNTSDQMRGRLSVRLQWMNEFSDVGSVLSDMQTLKLSKVLSSAFEYHASDQALDGGEESKEQSENKKKMRRGTSINVLLDTIKKNQSSLEDFGSINFNIFNIVKKIDREQVLPIMTLQSLYNSGLRDIINDNKISLFLDKVVNTYKQDVQYHNDLHGADVMQMAYYMLHTCNMIEKLELGMIDVLSFLLGAVCHDLGHDGYTNSYHVNAITSRAINSNDVSVQETFHAAEFFRILNQEEYNFLEEMTKDQFKIFRKNVIGLILATDMARHVADLSAFNAICSEYDIKHGNNLDKLFDNEDEISIAKNKQTILKQAMHACDVSQSGRPFEICNEWTYLLFEEFFDQGDLERKENLPITMLCDRTTTNVAMAQPGFISFIPQPLFNSLANVIPQVLEAVTAMKNNKELWKNYVETEENKKLYQNKKQFSVEEVDNETSNSHSEEDEKLNGKNK